MQRRRGTWIRIVRQVYDVGRILCRRMAPKRRKQRPMMVLLLLRRSSCRGGQCGIVSSGGGSRRDPFGMHGPVTLSNGAFRDSMTIDGTRSSRDRFTHMTSASKEATAGDGRCCK